LAVGTGPDLIALNGDLLRAVLYENAGEPCVTADEITSAVGSSADLCLLISKAKCDPSRPIWKACAPIHIRADVVALNLIAGRIAPINLNARLTIVGDDVAGSCRRSPNLVVLAIYNDPIFFISKAAYTAFVGPNQVALYSILA